MHFWQNCKAILAVLCLVALSACQPANSDIPVGALQIATKNGVRTFTVEAVSKPKDLEKGLMYRKELANDKGMLFLFGKQEPVSFWMKNTYIPLDLLFIQRDGKIVHIHKMAIPQDETPLPSKFPVVAVLEIYGGQADKQGIQVGDKLTSDFFPQTR